MRGDQGRSHRLGPACDRGLAGRFSGTITIVRRRVQSGRCGSQVPHLLLLPGDLYRSVSCHAVARWCNCTSGRPSDTEISHSRSEAEVGRGNGVLVDATEQYRAAGSAAAEDSDQRVASTAEAD
jgi:hypothetical protein